jgi:hypothetical protein
MSDLQAIADRIEIEAPSAECTVAAADARLGPVRGLNQQLLRYMLGFGQTELAVNP